MNDSGKKANYTGQRAESVIACILKERGYKFERQHKVGLSIFEHPIRCDFLVYDMPEFPDGLIIESKWQGSGGSVDEKYPYLVLNIKEVFPCPTIIVLDGGGSRPGAVKWLKGQVDRERLYGVYSLGEFLLWMNEDVSDPI
jgi:hypothetical protein